MPEKEDRPRRKMVVEEVNKEVEDQPKNDSSESTKIEVSDQTQSHIEPGIHEEPVSKPIEKKHVQVPVPEPKSGPGPLVIIIPGIFLLGALLGGIFFYQGSISSKVSTTPVAEQTIAGNPTPTPTPKPTEVDLTKYPINVLNGSGIKGEAGKVQDILEKAGFKISATGNASNYSYTETVIQVKSTVEEGFVTKLRESLGKSYKVAAKIQSLGDASKDEVVIIIGSTKP